MAVLGGIGLASRAGLALLLANARYWPTVAPATREQLHYWEDRARTIPDPYLRSIALAKFHAESFNAEGTTTLATLASRDQRVSCARAIVALQVMYDYLDGLAEQSTFNRTHNARLFTVFTDALTPNTQPHDYYSGQSHNNDGGYLLNLAAIARDAVTALPGAEIVIPFTRRAAERCAEAQQRVHTGAPGSHMRCWALHESAEATVSWQEFLAGAVTSILSSYALIVAGTNRHVTPSQARAIDAAYMSISALATMLDTLIDYQHDRHMETQWFMPYYEGNRALFAEHLTRTARRAITQIRALPHSAHHYVTVVGVAAYYLSAPEARDEPARALTAQLQRDLRPLLTPTLGIMRAWRAAKTT